MRHILLSAALLFAVAAPASAQTGLVYSFSSGSGDEIRMVTFAGVDGGALVSPTNGSSPFGLSQGLPSGYIFWTDILDDVIYRSNSNGSGETTAFSTILPGDTSATVQSINVDSATGRIFWGDSSNDAIRVANCDGSGATTLYTSSSDAGSPNGVLYDPVENRVLWGDSTADAIMEYDLDTGIASKLVELDVAISDGSYTPKGMAITSTNIYLGDSGPDKIFVADLDGSNAAELLDIPAFYAANGNFGDTDSNSVINELIAVNDVLYWTEGNSGKRGIYGYDLNTATGFQLLDTGTINSGAAPLKLAAWELTPSIATPATVSVTTGELFAGGTSELGKSDNQDFSISRNPLGVSSRTRLVASAGSPDALPDSMVFTLEASVFARGAVTQTIELFNYDTSSWEQIDSRAATRNVDSITEVTLSGQLSRFVQPGSLQMEARVTFDGSTGRLQFNSNIDLIQWTID
ncbi:MAG: hypothetical protein AAF456_09810 [Planctomycetota bacterium]